LIATVQPDAQQDDLGFIMPPLEGIGVARQGSDLKGADARA
jgi:hypothetical protein